MKKFEPLLDENNPPAQKHQEIQWGFAYLYRSRINLVGCRDGATSVGNGSGWEIGIQQLWYALADSCGNVYLTIRSVWIEKKRLSVD